MVLIKHMDFFETPPWDGDQASDKLTHELFRCVNVPLVKVSKKRKRNKYPKGSPIDEHSKNSDFPKEGKDKIIKLKKTGACDTGEILQVETHSLISIGKKKCKEVPQQAEKRVKSNNQEARIKWSCQSSNVRDSIQSISLSNSISSSTLSSNRPIQHKKKKRKQKHIALEGELKNFKSDHNLKILKDKLDLDFKVKSCNKESNKGISTPPDQKKNKPANIFIEEHIHGKSGHAIKCLPKKPSFTLKCDQKYDKLLSHLKKKKSETDTLANKKVKIRAMETTNLSQSVAHNKGKQSLTSVSLDNQSSSSVFQKKILSDVSSANKFKKRKKKNAETTCENASAVIKVTSSHSLGMPTTTKTKKRKHSENYETAQKKVKNLRKDGDSQLDFDSLSDEMPSPRTNVVLHQSKELDYVDGMNNLGALQSSIGVTSPKKKLTLREKMMEKLRGSRFRFLNEQIYSSKSEETRKFFQIDPASFEAYHEGYKQQLSQWPMKPVDIIIKYLKKKPTNYIIADFGCGDAQIAQSLPNQVHSFDHVALNDHVTVCDMTHTPLSNGSVDVAVFCLSLMGSNLSDYVYEANRVLKIGGILKIAEVESRFDDVDKFIKVITKFGFLCISRDLSKDVFYLFDFKKEKNLKDGKSLPNFELRSCSYKKR